MIWSNQHDMLYTDMTAEAAAFARLGRSDAAFLASLKGSVEVSPSNAAWLDRIWAEYIDEDLTE